MKHFFLFILTAALLLASFSALTAQDDERLDDLFVRLQRAENADEAQAIEIFIWQIWTESGKEEIDTLMSEGIDAIVERDLDSALAIFDQIVERAPDFAEGWNKRATVHYLMENYTASILDIQRTLTLEPRHFGAVSGLGLIYMAIGDDGAALDAFKKALEINPHMPGAREHVRALKKKLAGRPI